MDAKIGQDDRVFYNNSSGSRRLSKWFIGSFSLIGFIVSGLWLYSLDASFRSYSIEKAEVLTNIAADIASELSNDIPAQTGLIRDIGKYEPSLNSYTLEGPIPILNWQVFRTIHSEYWNKANVWSSGTARLEIFNGMDAGHWYVLTRIDDRDFVLRQGNRYLREVDHFRLVIADSAGNIVSRIALVFEKRKDPQENELAAVTAFRFQGRWDGDLLNDGAVEKDVSIQGTVYTEGQLKIVALRVPVSIDSLAKTDIAAASHSSDDFGIGLEWVDINQAGHIQKISNFVESKNRIEYKAESDTKPEQLFDNYLSSCRCFFRYLDVDYYLSERIEQNSDREIVRRDETGESTVDSSTNSAAGRILSSIWLGYISIRNSVSKIQKSRIEYALERANMEAISPEELVERLGYGGAGLGDEQYFLGLSPVDAASGGRQRPLVIVGASMYDGIVEWYKNQRFSTAVFLITLFMLLLVAILLNKLVFARLTALSELVRGKTFSTNATYELELGKSDEIGTLVRALDTMLEQRRKLYEENLREQKLLQDHRLASIGQIGHNIKTPVHNLFMMIPTHDGEKEELKRRIDFAVNALQGTLQGGGVSERKRIELVSYLEKKFAYDEEIEFATRVPRVNVSVVRDNLDDTIENIIGNAMDFRCPNTTITVKVFVNNRKVFIAIANEGPSIPDEDLERIFDFGVSSRKGVDGGVGTHSGIGLYSARDMARSIGGDLIARNLVKGPMFLLSFKCD